MATPLIRTLSLVPRMASLEGFHCTTKRVWRGGGGGDQLIKQNLTINYLLYWALATTVHWKGTYTHIIFYITNLIILLPQQLTTPTPTIHHHHHYHYYLEGKCGQPNMDKTARNKEPCQPRKYSVSTSILKRKQPFAKTRKRGFSCQ